MTDTSEKIDYSKTLYLPQTDFPMRAGLPEKEPLLVKRWQDLGMYRRLREDAAGRQNYVLHDGPPYANGHIHIGHALNKVLKDVITRSFQMRGFDFELRAGLGLPRPADRMEDRGTVPRQRQGQGPRCRSTSSGRNAAVCRPWIKVQTRRVPPARRRGRLRQSLHHDDLPRRGADRRRAAQIRHSRASSIAAPSRSCGASSSAPRWPRPRSSTRTTRATRSG